MTDQLRFFRACNRCNAFLPRPGACVNCGATEHRLLADSKVVCEVAARAGVKAETIGEKP